MKTIRKMRGGDRKMTRSDCLTSVMNLLERPVKSFTTSLLFRIRNSFNDSGVSDSIIELEAVAYHGKFKHQNQCIVLCCCCHYYYLLVSQQIFLILVFTEAPLWDKNSYGPKSPRSKELLMAFQKSEIQKEKDSMHILLFLNFLHDTLKQTKLNYLMHAFYNHNFISQLITHNHIFASHQSIYILYCSNQIGCHYCISILSVGYGDGI